MAHRSYKLLVIVFLAILLTRHQAVGTFTPGDLPASQQNCLYITSSNSRVLIGEQKSALTLNETDFDFVSVEGFSPTGIAVYDGVAYVASVKGIEAFSINTTSPGRWRSGSQGITTLFIDFMAYITTFACDPRGMVVWNDTLFLACESGIPYSIVKFSLADEDYGAFIGGALSGDNEARIYDLTLVEREGRTYLYFDDEIQRVLYRVDLTAMTRNGTMDYQEMFNGGQVNYRTSWKGLGYSATNDTLYIIETTRRNSTRSDILLGYDLKTGIAQRQVPAARFQYTSSFCLTPDGMDIIFLENVPLVPGYLVGLDMDGATVGTTFTQHNMFPQFCQFYQCPAPSSKRDSSSSKLTSTEQALVIVFSSLTLMAVGCVGGIGIALFIAYKWKGRRRTYDDEEMGCVYTIRQNDEGYSFREIDPTELRVESQLGAGAFGKVYKGYWRNAEVAIKTIEGVSLASADEAILSEIRSEAQLMARLGNHPNVVSFIGAVTKTCPEKKCEETAHTDDCSVHIRNRLCLVLEYCPHGSVFDLLIKRREKIPLVTLIRMARDAATGILHLHRERIVHRDIAARNMLVGQNYEVYISDFGMARLRHEEVQTTQTTVGPIAWMAPESMLRREYSEFSDVFSFGVLLWEMVTRKQPWRGMHAMQIVVAVTKKNTRLRIPADCDPVLRNIIRACWKEKPERRIRMKEISDRLTSYYEKLKRLYEDFNGASEESEDVNAKQEETTTMTTTIGLSVAADEEKEREQEEREEEAHGSADSVPSTNTKISLEEEREEKEEESEESEEEEEEEGDTGATPTENSKDMKKKKMKKHNNKQWELLSAASGDSQNFYCDI